jgi:hypothetical protein
MDQMASTDRVVSLATALHLRRIALIYYMEFFLKAQTLVKILD